MRRRIGVIAQLVAAMVIASGCSAPITPTTLEFPATISVNSQPFDRAPYWTRGGISGVVYVPSGEQWPAASTHVGAIISSEHLTSSELLKWMRKESIRQGEVLYHESGEGEESCKVGADPPRIYVAVGVCKTGVARAACVEVDEALDTPTFTRCHRSSGYACFEDVCNQQWLAWGEAMDLLAADVLTIR